MLSSLSSPKPQSTIVSIGKGYLPTVLDIKLMMNYEEQRMMSRTS